ncbi:MAG: dipeptide epimerase [Bacteroidota bacterium]
MIIKQILIYRYSIPMVPFTIATGTMNYAQNVLIKIVTEEGIIGVGECSAFPMIAGETQDTCLVLAKDFAKLWKGKDPLDIPARMNELDLFIAGNNTIKSAFDMALYDIVSKQANLPLYQYLGGNYFEPESDLTIGIATVEKMAAQALEFVNQKQVSILKVKLGKSALEDVERIKAIRQAVGKNIQIRIDANQGWNFDEAVYALTRMQNFDIQFCEQPMPKYLDEFLPLLRRKTSIPVMADESVFTHHDAQRLINQQACDYINIKLSKAGGIKGALSIHEVCAKENIPNMLGGMLESRLALSANVHLALACSNIKFYDLDTCLLGHKLDPVINGVRFEGMKLQLPGLPGIGADVDPGFLAGCEQFIV